MLNNIFKLTLPYLPAFGLMVTGLSAIGVSQLKPPQTGTVIALFDSKLANHEILNRLNAQTDFILTKGPTRNSFIITSEVANLPQRLTDNGAWLILNYRGAAGCVSTPILPNSAYLSTEIS